MPVFRPSILFSDASGSMGSLTFYHRGGQCYTRRRARATYPATPAQLGHLEVHRRAIQAWRQLDHSTQLLWNELSVGVEPHRPPFDHKAVISGNNLFVSAYHGYALMGQEHTPSPKPFVKFPPFAVSFLSAEDDNGELLIRVRSSVSRHDHFERYRLYVRLSLSTPGTGYSVRGMRGFLGVGDCSGIVTLSIPGYKEIWRLGLPEYQIHSNCVLLDSTTGYRSQMQRYSTVIAIS